MSNPEVYEVKVYGPRERRWFQNGNHHRLDGPAIEYANGDRYWCQNDKLHRLDGPAVEYSSGTRLWYIEGVNLTEEEFLERIQPTKELTIGEISKLLGYEVKIVK